MIIVDPWTILFWLGVVAVIAIVWNFLVDALDYFDLLIPTLVVVAVFGATVWLSWMNHIPSVQQ